MNGSGQKSDSEVSDSFEKQIDLILKKIAGCKSFEEARHYFDELEPIQYRLAKIVFKEGVVVSTKLRKFVKDYDRLDDLDTRKFLFSVIKSDGYVI